ncbi:MAG TPA: serine hydrolase domain-containing protein, partial [Kofleriaceae bacterium]|nr:serine hydrolase domain-containing protein [Kofleriaceae bacterium]
TGEAPAPVDNKPPADPAPVAETLAADTPKATVNGNTFLAPAGWKIVVRGTATVMSAPEGDSHVALVDVQAKDADEAVALAWTTYGKTKLPPLEIKQQAPDRDGWSKIQGYNYQLSPNEKRSMGANARFANGSWTVALIDVSDATAEKRGAQFGVIFGQLFPKGYERESFAGKKAHPLDKARIAALAKYIEDAQKQLSSPGVALGLVQNGKVVFAGGFGVRQLGKPAKVDGDTKFMIASNTKAMTTLMLAKLVDEKKLAWETAVTTLYPQFKLGDADTTSKVLVRHLICACTGLPRQDLEMIFEASRIDTPAKVLAGLSTMQPTSKFGELFQYSNPLAAAAGYVGGYVASPKLELGKAYDEAMRTRVFAPLGMTATTFDFKRAQTGNYAVAHGDDVDGKPVVADPKVNELIVPARPAGGAWSTVRDVLKYVQMELAEGKLANGKPYISKEALLARREPQVAISQDGAYGMGLMINKRYGVTVVEHGGDLIGFHSNMLWLPEHGVGAVILTNGDGGGAIRSVFKRKLLEVLFDGSPEADASIAQSAKNRAAAIEVQRKQLTIPAADDEAAKLAAKYHSDALGPITVTRAKKVTTFDFGEWKSEVATRKNPDGTTSFVTLIPGLVGFELVPGTANGKRTLIVRDSQHEYVFTEV